MSVVSSTSNTEKVRITVTVLTPVSVIWSSYNPSEEYLHLGNCF